MLILRIEQRILDYKTSVIPFNYTSNLAENVSTDLKAFTLDHLSRVSQNLSSSFSIVAEGERVELSRLLHSTVFKTAPVASYRVDLPY